MAPDRQKDMHALLLDLDVLPIGYKCQNSEGKQNFDNPSALSAL